MITTKNYFDRTAGIDFDNLPEALAKGHALVSGAAQNDWEHYRKVENIKRVVDAYFEKLDSYLQAHPQSSKTTFAPQQSAKPVRTRTRVEPKQTAEKPKKAVKTAKPSKTKSGKASKAQTPEYKTTPVESLDTDVQFIRRYALMDGKVKTQAQVLTLIHSLQKAILERRIKKTSPYAAVIKLVQEQLIKLYEKMGDAAEIRIAPASLKRYQEIASAQTPMLSIALLKSYVSLNGKRGVDDKIEKLLARMKKAADSGKVTRDDKYVRTISAAYKSMAEHINNKSEVLTIHPAELNGIKALIRGKAGVRRNQKKSPYSNGVGSSAHETNAGNTRHYPEVIPSATLMGMQFETIGLQGKYRQLIGDPSVGFTAMVYGLPKSGKSTLCLDMAHYLAVHHGKVLYCAIEEGFGYTLQEKVGRLKASHPRLYVTDRVPENPGQFDFVFIDSVTKAGLEIEDMDALRKAHPRTSFIFIYHTTKEGRFKGSNTHAHEVDVIIQVENGRARGN
ncbi:MAG: DNA repair protein RadA, partial [Saprospiraceae bacterium]|nr:DNA repair protein RadA [Saprospiraceae bacterium]